MERRLLVWVNSRPFYFCVLVLPLLAPILFDAVSNTQARRAARVVQPNDDPKRGEERVEKSLSLNQRRTVEKEISTGQTHAYSITLNAGQYLRLMIESWGTDARASVYDPDGQLHTEINCSRRGIIPLSIIAEASGEYRLEVIAPGESSIAGRYQVKIEEVRRATAQDHDRLPAEIAFAEAEQLRAGRLIGSGDKAIRKYEEARNHWLAAGDRRAEAYALMNIGQVYQSLNRFDNAIAFYNQALALYRALHDLRGECEVLNNSGYLHSDTGDNEKAQANATRALKLSRVTGNPSAEAQALHTLGDVSYNFGDLQKALGYYREALQLWQRLNDHQGQARVLVSFGYAYVEISNIESALDSYRQALSISRSANDRHLEAVTLRAFGNLQTKLGENQKAFNLFLQALEILKTVDDPHLKATVLGGLAYSYECVGEKRRALEYYEQALAAFKEINHRWGEAESEMPIGEIYYSLGEYESALYHYQRALSLFHALKMPRWEAMTIRNIGLVYDSLGDKSKALDYYQQSLALTRAGQDQRHEAYTLNYVGRIFETSGQKQKALGYYHRALQLNRVAVDRSGESLTLYNTAHAERDSGSLDEARSHIEAALEIAESLRTKVASQDLRAAYFASARQSYDLYIDILMRLHKEHSTAGFDVMAFGVSERARARSLLESLKEARADIHQGIDPVLLERERLLQQSLNAKAERHVQLLNDKRQEEAKALAKEIDQLIAQYDEIKAWIKAASPHYAALTQPQPLSLHEIQRQVLDDDSILLEYALGNDRSYLWAVTRTEISSFELPSREQVESAARRVYNLLTANQPMPGETFEQHQARVAQARTQLASEIASLSELVLGPVITKLGNKRLLIVTDGALQYIPFQALTLPETADGRATSDNLKPLCFNHQIVNEPSASVLALILSETAHRQPAPKTVAVLADPVFETDDPRISSQGVTQVQAALEPPPTSELRRAFRDIGLSGNGDQIPRLPASRDEAESIMAVTPSGTGFKAMGFEASRETATKHDLSQYRIVHFATHGILNNEHPELSGIVLSLVDRQGQRQDGFLRLDEIYNLNLPVDLVVLSACNTGLGKDVKGEGFVGLTRGFMYAGASSVVASLWKVDDEATAELMKHFYKFMLQDGLPPADALRQSQLAMWKQKRWHEPYYWAGFIIQGQYLGKENLSYHRDDQVKPMAAFGAVVIALSLSAFYFIRRRHRGRS